MSSNSNAFSSLICVNELSLSSSQRTFTSSCVLFDSRITDNRINHATDTETITSSKQIRKEESSKRVTSTTTAPMNHRAAGAIMKQITSIPNILTLSRIAATPYLSYLLITHHQTKQTRDEIIVTTATSAETIATNIDLSSAPIYALSLFLVMGFTDFLDGYIARKYPSTSTVLGTYLDPFADKVFISVLSMTLWYTETLPGTLVSLWVARDIGMVFGAYYLVKQETLKRIDSDGTESVAVMDPKNTPIKVEASLLSKINTALQIGLIALGIAGEVPGVNIDTDFMASLCWMTCGTTVGSTIGYLGGTAFRKSGSNQ